MWRTLQHSMLRHRLLLIVRPGYTTATTTRNDQTIWRSTLAASSAAAGVVVAVAAGTWADDSDFSHATSSSWSSLMLSISSSSSSFSTLPVAHCDARRQTEVDDTRAAILRRQQTIRQIEEAAERRVKLEERYDVDWKNPLGEGSFGCVYAATHRRTSDRVAIKKICKTLTDNATFAREMDALLHLRQSGGGHPNICGLRENFDEDGYYYLVLDLIDGCEMFEALIQDGAYSEADAARLVQETASALDYLHGIQIVHGDLKPENLMLSSQHVSDSVIKVVDFGCAQVTHEMPPSSDQADAAAKMTKEALESTEEEDPATSAPSNGTGVARTPAYCPPEVLEARLVQRDGAPEYRVEPSLDMWALGVILYVMLTGVHPFDLCGNATNEEIERQILLRKMPPLWNSSMTSHLSDDAIALIEQLLQWDSSKRLTAHQVLENPWVRGETASSDKMADSDKRLSKYRLYKSKLGARVFASMVLLAPRADGKKTAHDQSSDSRTSLIEHAFRRLDHGRKGYVTTADIQQLTQQQPQTEIAEKSNDEEPMSLSSFADLMSETMKNQYFPKGHVIYHEGDVGECMYFLNSGVVEVFASDGFTKLLQTPGDYFGEGALVDPRKIRSASIRCVTPVHVIEVSRTYFEKYMAEDCDLKSNLREVHNSRKRQRANAVLQLQQSLEEKVYKRGEYLFKEGEPGHELYILEKGQVDTSVNGHKVFSVSKRGDIVGESSIVFQRPRNVAAQCRSKQCKLHVLRSEEFHKISESHPAMKESIRDMCLRREFQKGVCVKSQRPFPETENDLRSAFDAVDVDKSGKLELRNIRNLIERLDSRFTDQEIHEILKSLDLDENGSITWEEFKLIFGMDSIARAAN